MLGALLGKTWASVESNDRNAWIATISHLRSALEAYRGLGTLYLEYDIPRVGKRIDAVLLLPNAVLVLEFKCGATHFLRHDVEQAWDYALDLKYFQSACRTASIVPVLIATDTESGERLELEFSADNVATPMRCSGARIRAAIDAVLSSNHGQGVVRDDWEVARYSPAPTIIEAARSLYANHKVEDITRHGAGADNLSRTGLFVNDLIARAKQQNEKVICFVTGVPGAGKTLVGLDVATRQLDESDQTQSVFLSGNGPLVAVLQEALACDEHERAKFIAPISKAEARRRVKSFIQIVHHFRDDCLVDDKMPPVNHVALFDEAQRAWNETQTAKFMATKKGIHNFSQSESRFLISCFDRHQDWAVIVCLVGSGQEINSGEAGVGEWLRAISDHFPNWKVALAPELERTEPDIVAALADHVHVNRAPELHLNTSIRSFRSAHVSQFVNELLDTDLNAARTTLKMVLPEFPIVLTRDIARAKQWLRAKSRGSERHGMIVSSGAQRLRPLGIDVRVPINPVHWFLHDSADVRSSDHLEDVGTEFQVQGLELDWTCVVWDADLRFATNLWSFHDFSGTRWQKVNKPERQRYLLNTYRVLLTRARQGMIIVVPEGDGSDRTRLPSFYDPIFHLLTSIGLPELR